MSVWTHGVSVVIPTFNDASALPGLFDQLRACEVLEVCVCDLGSSDDSVRIARSYGAQLVRGDAGLARGLNAGMQHLRGSAVWLLSPICRPPRFGAAYICEILSDPDYSGGHFPVTYRRDEQVRRVLSWQANLRASLLGTVRLEHGPYVDRLVLDRIGGIPEGADPLRQLYAQVCRRGEIFVMPECIDVVASPQRASDGR